MASDTSARTSTSAASHNARGGWAILGPGAIARTFLRQLPSSGGELVAVGSSDPARAQALADEATPDHAALTETTPAETVPVEPPCAETSLVDSTPAGPTITTGTYAEALAVPRVDAVYVATVHPGHPELVLAALDAGKAVLCEKPLSVNSGTTMALVDAAQRAGVPLLEAYMYRFHPQTRKVLELVRAGTIGHVTHIDASFAFRVEDRQGRLFDPATAGGGILDVGGYPVTFAAAIVDAATGAHASEPVGFEASGTVGPTGVDEWTVAHATYAGGVSASLRCGIRMPDDNAVVVHGSRGRIRVSDPWIPQGETTIELTTTDEGTQMIRVEAAEAYGLETKALIEALRAGHLEVAEMTHAETLATARTLDRWREAVGVRYPFEAETANIQTVPGRPLAVQSDAVMPYGTVAHVTKPVSRLVMGVDNQPNLAHASALFDTYIEAGGNTFDTAHIYGNGEYERRFGQWVRNRGVRDDIVVIAKGGHTPHCDPESVVRQLDESLDRQGTDRADIYMLHRDNPQIPVGEFVDVLDELRLAGRFAAYGGSNWTPTRVDEANEYARKNGRQGFTVLSNHFGLAEALDVPWPGCEHSTDRASKVWLEERQITLMPWSSQARGFFTGRAHPDSHSDPELVRCYYSDENFERLRRAEHLATERRVPTTAIALAYVLAQPFPTFPLFGPRTIEESRSSMRGLTVELTAEEVAWLDLRG